MKRMYVVLGIMFLFLAWTLTSLGQMITSDPVPTQPQMRQPFDRMKRRMELREEMHRRMREKLLNNQGPDQNLFGDMEQMMDEAMKEAFSGFDNIQMDNDNFKTEWLQTKEGRTLVVTPQTPNQKLDFDVKSTVITIKGQSEQKTQGTMISSSFSNSFPVPEDCDGSKVKMSEKEGKIHLEFPYRVNKTVTIPKDDDRKPLPPSAGDVTI